MNFMNYHSKTNRLTEIFICDLAAERFGAEAYLPSEQRLAEQYQASRNTIRRMLDTLISDGTLLRDENRRVRVNPAQPQKNAAPDRQQLNFAWAYAAYPDPMVSEVSSGIQDYMREKQLNLQLIASHESHETVLNALGHAPQLGFDGVLVLNYRQERYDSTIDRLLDSGIPVVTVGPAGKSRAGSLSGDDFGGVFAAISRLIEKYDRPVWFVSAPAVPADLENDERFLAYTLAMRNAGFGDRVEEYNCMVLCGDAPKYWPLPQKLFRAPYQFSPFLARMQFPASVFCCDDYVANRLCLAAHEAGLKVGQDLAVIGFGALPFAKRLDPPLATVRVDSRSLGYQAARLLHRSVADRFGTSVRLKIPAEFIERKSM